MWDDIERGESYMSAQPVPLGIPHEECCTVVPGHFCFRYPQCHNEVGPESIKIGDREFACSQACLELIDAEGVVTVQFEQAKVA